jgi:hypothetical protein
MNTISQGWQHEQCPTGDGIYFPDDTYWPLDSLSTVSCRLTVEPSVEMAQLYVDVPLTENGQFQIYGGETSWEGCGYLALVSKPNRRLVWLIHSSQSEPFRNAKIESDSISANSGEYPLANLWRIPIDAPQELSVVRSRV